MKVTEIELSKTHAFSQYSPLKATLRARIGDDDDPAECSKELSRSLNAMLHFMSTDERGLDGKMAEKPIEKAAEKPAPVNGRRKRGRPSKAEVAAAEAAPEPKPDPAPAPEPKPDPAPAPEPKPAPATAAAPSGDKKTLRQKFMSLSKAYYRAISKMDSGSRKALADKLGFRDGPQEALVWPEDKIDRAMRILSGT